MKFHLIESLGFSVLFISAPLLYINGHDWEPFAALCVVIFFHKINAIAIKHYSKKHHLVRSIERFKSKYTLSEDERVGFEICQVALDEALEEDYTG